VDEPSICATHSLDVAGSEEVTLPSGLDVPAITFSQQVDISDSLKDIGDITKNIEVNVNQLLINNTNGSMNWVQYVEVDISGQDFPTQTIVKYTTTGENSSTLDLPVLISVNELYNYLASGTATLTFVLAGIVPNATPELNGTLCVEAKASDSKSL
jgi:hypothetical protein